MENVLPLFVVIPLAAGFVLPVVGLLKPGRFCAPICLGAVGALVVLSCMMFAGEPVVVTWMGGWVGQADPSSVTGIAMVCDGLTRLILLIISVVSLAAVLFSTSYMRSYTKVCLYYGPMMLMIAGMNGVVLSGDLFNIYVFLEVAAIASYALVGFGVESEELEASFKYLVLSAIASGFILLGVAIVYNLTGTLNLAQIGALIEGSEPNKALLLAIGLFLAGFGLKAAMVPFHAWLPDAHPSAPAPVSAMLSGILIKASGVYVLARIVFNVVGVHQSAVPAVLIMMGTLSLVVGALLMTAQWDFKRLLAYSSISHMGYVILALGVGAEQMAAGQHAAASLIMFAGLFHLANHAVFKSLLFLCSGSVVHRTGLRDMRAVAGIARRMPVTGFCTRVGSLSIGGVPPFNGFFSKLLIVIGLCWAGHPFLAVVAVLISFVTLYTFIKVQRYVLEGDVPQEFSAVTESPLPMLVAMAFLSVLCLGMGLLLPLHRFVLLEPAKDALFNGLGYARSVFGG